jgi:hypothetical protein
VVVVVLVVLAGMQLALNQVLEVLAHFLQSLQIAMAVAVAVAAMGTVQLQHVSTALVELAAEEQAMDQMELQLEWLEHLELQTLAVAVVVPETQVVITAKVAMVDQV